MMKPNCSRNGLSQLVARSLAAMDRLLSPVGVIGIVENKNQIKMRLKMLTSFKKTRSASIVGMALLTIIGSATFTSAQDPKADADVPVAMDANAYDDIPAPYADMARKLELTGKELQVFADTVAKASEAGYEWQKYDNDFKAQLSKLVKLHGQAIRNQDASESKRTLKLQKDLKQVYSKKLETYSKQRTGLLKAIVSLLTVNQKGFLLSLQIHQQVESSLARFKLTDSQSRKVTNMIAQAAREGVQSGEFLVKYPGFVSAGIIIRKAGKDVVTNEQWICSMVDYLRSQVGHNLAGMQLSEKQRKDITLIIRDQAETVLHADKYRDPKGSSWISPYNTSAALKRIHQDVLKKEQVLGARESAIRELLLRRFSDAKLIGEQEKRLAAAITEAVRHRYDQESAREYDLSTSRMSWMQGYPKLYAKLIDILTPAQKIESMRLFVVTRLGAVNFSDAQKQKMDAILKKHVAKLTSAKNGNAFIGNTFGNALSSVRDSVMTDAQRKEMSLAWVRKEIVENFASQVELTDKQISALEGLVESTLDEALRNGGKTVNDASYRYAVMAAHQTVMTKILTLAQVQKYQKNRRTAMTRNGMRF